MVKWKLFYQTENNNNKNKQQYKTQQSGSSSLAFSLLGNIMNPQKGQRRCFLPHHEVSTVQHHLPPTLASKTDQKMIQPHPLL